MKNIVVMDEKRSNIVFHFNKKHLENPKVPMWVIKHKGITYYVHHIDVDKGVGFSSKETPENQENESFKSYEEELMEVE